MALIRSVLDRDISTLKFPLSRRLLWEQTLTKAIPFPRQIFAQSEVEGSQIRTSVCYV
jgi:hypothetical protein